MFQHTAARRRLVFHCFDAFGFLLVSTHSRPKAAGCASSTIRTAPSGFSTQPPEGGWIVEILAFDLSVVSTHSRPKAAGTSKGITMSFALFQHTAARRRLAEHLGMRQNGQACFNTQPPEGGWFTSLSDAMCICLFQHTAARRRLAGIHGRIRGIHGVSTHSRPKAAGLSR